MKIDLKNTTFMTAVRFDSEQREFNFLYNINYLCKTFDTNIIINESDVNLRAEKLLSNLQDISGSNIKIMGEKSNKAFHRTRLLNEILNTVKTECVANYDIDAMCIPEAYTDAEKEIISGGADLIYPYFRGSSQKKINTPHDIFFDIFDYPFELWNSVCGHCCFLRTKSYIEGGMENENFISYSPEDSERMERFIKLGYTVKWLNYFVFHMEHPRGKDSSEKNPHFWDGYNLYKKLLLMNKSELQKYYSQQEYLKKYDVQRQF